MKAIQEAMARLLRGPRASRFLGSLGIDSRRYRLLMDLFGQLSERGEMLDQLGRNGVALQVMAWMYAAFSALLSILLVVTRPALATYFSTFLMLTAFLLFFVLLSETGNSLVNPVEGLVLADQPINGATYTAAKLTHLARIILYLVSGINAVPALAGLMLKESGWSYPLIHPLAALAIGFVAALLCCALYGWLIRLLPARRLGRGGRKSWMGEIVARMFGGQPGRAGFAFVSRMTRRDFQFRRQAVPMLVLGLPGFVGLAASGWRTDPLSGRFTTVHLLPHVFGFVLFFICSLLPYGNDFKGAWAFLLAPAQVFGRFARGVYAALWIQMIVIPHLAMLLLFAWPWELWRAGLFVAYSAAISSVYLALELRLIDGAPFTKQVDATQGATLLPLMIMGGLAMAIAVGLQYFFVFHSPATVVAATVAAGAAAYFLTRSSLVALADSIRYSLGLLSVESRTLYKEIDI